tara:strand:- start:327 stop:1172 length:846 start_codon:yes stop_codon:yes gene_type:complete
MSIRIIPRLDIKGPNLVKGIQLEGLRVLGSPSEFAKLYYKNGADEILYMDVVASLYGRNSLNKIIEETANEVFIPLAVGGGLKTLNDIESVLRSGADKVVINTAAVKNPDFINQATREFGSSTIAISIEAIKQEDNSYMAYTDNGREYTGLDIVDWSKEIEQNGAGEIIITSVNREGTGEGFDLNLVNLISDKINLPLVVNGGAGKKEDVLLLLENDNVNAISAASIFHYNYIQEEGYDFRASNEGNTDFLSNIKINKNLSTINISDLKSYLNKNNIKIRI